MHWAKRDENRFSRSAAASPSARRREQRPQPGRSKVCGRARRRALCARCTRLKSQASPRATRHARMHEYLTHHTAWSMDGMLASCARRQQQGSQAERLGNPSWPTHHLFAVRKKAARLRIPYLRLRLYRQSMRAQHSYTGPNFLQPKVWQVCAQAAPHWAKPGLLLACKF